MTVYRCTLAKKFDPGKHNVHGWMMSEKLDGVRALWCPARKGFFSRSDKPLNVPPSWIKMFSRVNCRLDGEFFMGRGQFQKCVSAVRKKSPTEDVFNGVQYVVFDCVTCGTHNQRLAHAVSALEEADFNIGGAGICYVLKHYKVTSTDQASAKYREILAQGGEGIMFRNGAEGYEMKRTGNLLKWKDEIDGIALVTGYDPGKGKHEGRVGALVVVCNDTGVTFRVGTGLSDDERDEWQERFDSPHLLQTELDIRWRAMERTKDNIPRHPVYHGVYKGE